MWYLCYWSKENIEQVPKTYGMFHDCTHDELVLTMIVAVDTPYNTAWKGHLS